MNAITEAGPGNSMGSMAAKPLWVAVGVLGAAVVALAGALVYTQTRSADVKPGAAQSGLSQNQNPSESAASASRLLANSIDAKSGESLVQDEVSKPATAAAKQAQEAPKSAAQKTEKVKPRVPAPAPAVVAQAPVPSPAPTGAAGGGTSAPGAPAPAVAMPAPAAAKPICTSCGTVLASNPLQQNAAASGVGMVAGGVVGGVLGNQVGGGSGKTAATVLGVLGGGWAGNEVEKRMKKVTVYDTSVQMENGSTRNFTLAQPVSAGARVTVEGSSLRLADGTRVGPLPPPPPPGPAVQSTTNNPNNN